MSIARFLEVGETGDLGTIGDSWPLGNDGGVQITNCCSIPNSLEFPRYSPQLSPTQLPPNLIHFRGGRLPAIPQKERGCHLGL